MGVTSAAPLVCEPVHLVSASGFCRVLGYVRAQQEVFEQLWQDLAVLVGDLYENPVIRRNSNSSQEDGVQFGVDFMGNSSFKGPEVDPSALTLDLG